MFTWPGAVRAEAPQDPGVVGRLEGGRRPCVVL